MDDELRVVQPRDAVEVLHGLVGETARVIHGEDDVTAGIPVALRVGVGGLEGSFKVGDGVDAAGRHSGQQGAFGETMALPERVDEVQDDVAAHRRGEPHRQPPQDVMGMPGGGLVLAGQDDDAAGENRDGGGQVVETSHAGPADPEFGGEPQVGVPVVPADGFPVVVLLGAPGPGQVLNASAEVGGHRPGLGQVADQRAAGGGVVVADPVGSVPEGSSQLRQSGPGVHSSPCPITTSSTIPASNPSSTHLPRRCRASRAASASTAGSSARTSSISSSIRTMAASCSSMWSSARPGSPRYSPGARPGNSASSAASGSASSSTRESSGTRPSKSKTVMTNLHQYLTDETRPAEPNEREAYLAITRLRSPQTRFGR